MWCKIDYMIIMKISRFYDLLDIVICLTLNDNFFPILVVEASCGAYYFAITEMKPANLFSIY